MEELKYEGTPDKERLERAKNEIITNQSELIEQDKREEWLELLDDLFTRVRESHFPLMSNILSIVNLGMAEKALSEAGDISAEMTVDILHKYLAETICSEDGMSVLYEDVIPYDVTEYAIYYPRVNNAFTSEECDRLINYQP